MRVGGPVLAGLLLVLAPGAGAAAADDPVGRPAATDPGARPAAAALVRAAAPRVAAAVPIADPVPGPAAVPVAAAVPASAVAVPLAAALPQPPTRRRYGLPVALALVALLGAGSLLLRALVGEPPSEEAPREHEGAVPPRW